jgi:hypothetical protein
LEKRPEKLPKRLSEETLMALADGALSDPARAEAEAILAADPSQLERLTPYLVTRGTLCEIFSEALTSPVPDRLVKTILTTPIGTGPRTEPVVRRGFAAQLRDLLFPEVPSFASAFALCSSVLMIAGAGWLAGLASRPAASPQSAIVLDGDTLYADGPLRLALETSPSKQATSNGTLSATPVLTFLSQDGRVCRQYDLARLDTNKLSGFACRAADGRWQIAFHAPAPQTAAGTVAADKYGPAGEGESFEALEGAIDKTIKGETLDAKAEAGIMANGWRMDGAHE